MLTPTDINFELNFPELMKGKKVELFHCKKCGYHPHVLITGFHKYNSYPLYTKVVRIYPQWTDIVETITHKVCSDDFEIIETLTCFNCGSNGEMKPIPRNFLQSCGLIREMDGCITVKNQINKQNWLIRIVKSILTTLGIQR